MLSSEKDLSICRLLVGWDALEKRLGGNPVIDFNLPGFADPGADMRYGSRLAVLDDLQKLQQDSEIKSDKRIVQKLRAQEAYLRNVMGEHWEFTRYIEATQGFTPRLFSEEEILTQVARAEAALSPWNIKINKNFENRFSQVQEEIPKAGIKDFYLAILDRSIEALTAIIGNIPHFNFRVEFDDVDAYWKNWVDGGQKNYRLRFNDRNVHKYENANMTLFGLHEMSAHLVQAVLLYEKIVDGILPRCMGLTTVHGPDQFQLEGLALTLPYFLRTADTDLPLLKAAQEVFIFEKMVESDNVNLINSGASIEDCTDHTHARMPYKTRDSIGTALIVVSTIRK